MDRRARGGLLVLLSVVGVLLGAAPAPASPAAPSSPAAPASSPAELTAVKERLDGLAESRGAPPAVSAWWVDPATRTVVLALSAQPRDARGAAFVEEARRVDASVRVVEGVAAPTPRADPPVYDLVGGDIIRIGRSRCSLGFSARTATGEPRLVTAGHCTNRGGDVTGANAAPIGPIRSSVFDRTGDWGVVDVGPAWRPTPSVAAEGSTTRSMTGTATAPVGASVCRSGSTTGWRCGTVTAVDVTANYAAGPVEGLVLTTACSEGGDSGGPFVSGGSALGVLSGGTGDCTAGGTSLYQPIEEILRTERLTLVVAT
ncbi:S1 family peptidase [Actinomycetospora straminea]|uniref:Streptogrisin C n=1 Tax=Actinomycetospora straminea TaxID=663607 RepID=A0ABP9E9E1_9PSEU|nr:S1 family peptidase [Actinomycetospora straminea]MDD7931957.1 S1 family peptidase [Actinomycetospora straminea]